ncbi:uncharacterized protein BT62DRAFT_939287 [Guyanagaster necrorhizus]|uniref:Uncharacterized protein n=1 Tax=Guyanagaster necrorhizus TaxID=856835 RepID=A0A9P7VDW2_9AGAR|nr:uncharacterized protein BT62DRAFT_939286 [Guyanagaster necrorhizus MCA 3950]XP_043032597.1 uncharacterized protein BT62DRAFT_939287 [Guyanagaster necrorhizus MCA 3950]KAG7439092.1 hypothetical protein BT62DRAFT_939286 [Guyanagaster necrorhizus MCA 3950]KAG7439093.1 hypothetical protein BT62DRAFT_939287 [Guyanagaster necrorhizus MCA 3950]
MQLSLEDPNNVNDMIVTITGSVEQQNLWYSPVVALTIKKDAFLKKYTNALFYSSSIFIRFFQSCTSPWFMGH